MIKPNLTYTRRSLPVVVPWDPAIDFEHSKMEDYLRTRDLKHLTFHPGMEPTKIYLKHVPKAFALSLASESNLAKAFRQWFQLAVEKIEHLRPHVCEEGIEIPGGSIPVWEPDGKLAMDNGKSVTYVADADVDELFNAATVMDIANLARERSFLAPGIVPRFLPMPTSTQLMRERMRSSIVAEGPIPNNATEGNEQT